MKTYPCLGLLNKYGMYVNFYILSMFHLKHYVSVNASKSYHVKENEAMETGIASYESLVDFNVFHTHEDSEGGLYIPVKYDIVDIIEQHAKGKNPLKF